MVKPVGGGMEPIPGSTGHKLGYTLAGMPVHVLDQNNTNVNNIPS